MIVAALSLVVELAYAKLPLSTIQLIGHVAASGANPVVIEPMDCKRSAIGKHDRFRCLINPEAQVLSDAGRSTSPWVCPR